MTNILNLRCSASLLLVVLLLSSRMNTSAQVTTNWDWAHSLLAATGGVTPPSSLQSQSICTDTSGGFFTAGNFLGLSIYYYPTGPSGSSVIENFGSTTYLDGYLYNYDTAGTITGSYGVPYGNGDVTVSRIITDRNNNSYIAGTFAGSIFHAVSGTMFANVAPASGTTDIFINKISPTGAALWEISAGGAYADNIGDICVDNNLNVYATGNTIGDFIAFGTDTVHSVAGQQKLYVTKYNSTGNVVWTEGFGQRGAEMGERNKICTDNNGYLYVSGPFTDTFRFGSAMLVNPLSSPPFGNATFVVKMDTNGNLVWLKGIYGNSDQPNIVCNSRGELYVSGYFNTASLVLDAFTIYSPFVSANTEIFITKLDTAGNVKWAQSAGGAIGQAATGISVDARDNGYLTGFVQSASIGFGNDTVRNAYPGQPIGFVFKFDSLGHPLYAKSLNPTHSADRVTPTGIAANKRGDVYITGNVKADTILCGSAIAPVIMSPLSSCFIAKIDSVPNCISAVTALSATTFCAGDSVVLNATTGIGSTYQWFAGSSPISGATSYQYSAHSGGVYSVNVTNSYSCISSANISVTVNPMPFLSSTLTPSSICDSTVFAYVPTSVTSGTTFDWSRTYVPGILSVSGSGSGSVSEVLVNTTYVPISVNYVYTLSATGCAGVDTVTVIVEPKPVLSSTLTPSAICDTVVFSYAPTSFVSGATFAWSRAAVTGISNPSASGTGNPNELLNNTTTSPVVVTYVYTVTANGCGNVQSVVVTINPCASALNISNAVAALWTLILLPNPTQNNLVITSSANITTVVITNLFGQQVFSGTYNNGKVELNVSQLPAGIYIAKINGIEIRRFVKE